MPTKTPEKEKYFSVLNSFKMIFSRKNLGKEAAEETQRRLNNNSQHSNQ